MPRDFCTSCGIDLPVIQAPMGGVATPELVAAVSNAGGLGLMPIWYLDVPGAVAVIHRIKALTDKPFGVNLNMDFPNPAMLDACLDEGVPVISIFWQLAPAFVTRAKERGAKVIFSAWDAASAVAAVSHGADAICAQGWEAGGHVRGNIGTLALVPAVVDAVGEVPVVAAGGIADGRGLAAVMALGASAAWVGTRFLAAQEAGTHPGYLARVFKASEADTRHFADLFDGNWPNAAHRVLHNETTRMWEEAGRPPSGQRPGEGEVLGTRADGSDVRRYASASPNMGTTGQVEAMSLWAGQGVSLVRKTQPAAEIVREIVEEARAILPF